MGAVDKREYMGGSGGDSVAGPSGKAAIQVRWPDYEATFLQDVYLPRMEQVQGGKGKGKNRLKVFWKSNTPIRNILF